MAIFSLKTIEVQWNVNNVNEWKLVYVGCAGVLKETREL